MFSSFNDYKTNMFIFPLIGLMMDIIMLGDDEEELNDEKEKDIIQMKDIQKDEENETNETKTTESETEEMSKHVKTIIAAVCGGGGGAGLIVAITYFLNRIFGCFRGCCGGGNDLNDDRREQGTGTVKNFSFSSTNVSSTNNIHNEHSFSL